MRHFGADVRQGLQTRPLPKACMTSQKAKILVAFRREGRFSVAGDRPTVRRGRRMVRAVIVSIALLAATVPAIAPALAQSGFDRPGGDYTSATVPTGDPAGCAAL